MSVTLPTLELDDATLADFKLAKKEFANNNLPLATELFEAIVGKYPHYAECWNRLGQSYYLLKDYLRAENAFAKAVEIYPENPLHQTNLGNARLKRYLYTEAKQCFLQALKIDEHFEKAHTGLAWACWKAGDYAEGYQYLKQAPAQLAQNTSMNKFIVAFSSKTENEGQKSDIKTYIDSCKTDGSFINKVNELVVEEIDGEAFGSHYYNWRSKRLKYILELFEPGWFRGKKILELGCGYGDIGMSLYNLGAEVTLCDGRSENLEEIKLRYPNYPKERIIKADINMEWPFEERYDLVLHLGVLYHLESWVYSLKRATECSDNLILETEVCDAEDLNVEVIIQEDGQDQSITGKGVRSSASRIEGMLSESGWGYARHDSPLLNSAPHRYDWDVQNTHSYGPQYRRFWVCKK